MLTWSTPFRISPSLCDPLFFPFWVTLLTLRVGWCLSSTLAKPSQLFLSTTNYGTWGCPLGERDNLQVQCMNLRSGFCRLLLRQMDPFHREECPCNLFILTFGKGESRRGFGSCPGLPVSSSRVGLEPGPAPSLQHFLCTVHVTHG